MGEPNSKLSTCSWATSRRPQYGPGVVGNFARLVRLIDRGVPMPFASVRNRRSIISVRNLADAIAASLHDPNAVGETFLVSDRVMALTEIPQGCSSNFLTLGRV